MIKKTEKAESELASKISMLIEEKVPDPLRA